MTKRVGSVAVVTGVASGIGLALARRAAMEGMNLVLADIAPDRLAEAAHSLALPPSRYLLQTVDVSEEGAVAALADAAFARFGAVHLLCNNAGVGLSRPVWEYTSTDWAWVLGVNLWSVIHGIRHFVPRMMAQDAPGHVVNTASAAGLLSTPGMAAYNVSKHGVVTLSETLYAELQAAGARLGVSVLCPAWVPTGIAESANYRPQRFGAAPPVTESAKAYEARKDQAVAKGRLSADDMADAVFDAVADKRFYVIPHRKLNSAIAVRMTDILELRNPGQVPA